MSHRPIGAPDLAAAAASRDLRRLNFNRASSLATALNKPLSIDTVYPISQSTQPSNLFRLPPYILDRITAALPIKDLSALALTCSDALTIARPAQFHRLRLIRRRRDMDVLEHLYMEADYPPTRSSLKAPIGPCIRALEVKRSSGYAKYENGFEMVTGIIPTLRNLAAFLYEGNSTQLVTAPKSFFAALAVSTAEHVSLTGFRIPKDLDLKELLGESFVWPLKTVRLDLPTVDDAGRGQEFIHDMLNMSSKSIRCLYLDMEEFIQTLDHDSTTLGPFPKLLHVTLASTRIDTSTIMSLYHPSSASVLRSLELSLYDYTFLVDFNIPSLTLVTVTNHGQALVDTPSYSFSIFVQANSQITHLNLVIREGRYVKHSHLATHFVFPLKETRLQSLFMVGLPDMLSSNMLRELSETTTLRQLRLKVVLPDPTEDRPVPEPLRVNHYKTQNSLATLKNLEILIIDGDIRTSQVRLQAQLDDLVAIAYQYAWTFPKLRLLIIDKILFRITVQDDMEMMVTTVTNSHEIDIEMGMLKKEFGLEEHMYEGGP